MGSINRRCIALRVVMPETVVCIRHQEAEGIPSQRYSLMGERPSAAMTACTTLSGCSDLSGTVAIWASYSSRNNALGRNARSTFRVFFWNDTGSSSSTVSHQRRDTTPRHAPALDPARNWLRLCRAGHAAGLRRLVVLSRAELEQLDGKRRFSALDVRTVRDARPTLAAPLRSPRHLWRFISSQFIHPQLSPR